MILFLVWALGPLEGSLLTSWLSVPRQQMQILYLQTELRKGSLTSLKFTKCARRFSLLHNEQAAKLPLQLEDIWRERKCVEWVPLLVGVWTALMQKDREVPSLCTVRGGLGVPNVFSFFPYHCHVPAACLLQSAYEVSSCHTVSACVCLRMQSSS